MLGYVLMVYTDISRHEPSVCINRPTEVCSPSTQGNSEQSQEAPSEVESK